MSTTETPVNGAQPGDLVVPALDLPKLHALPTEQQDLFLLTFVADLRQNALNIPAQRLPTIQPAIKKEIIKIVGLSAPLPSRIIRRSLGQILSDLYTRGSRQLLVETINDLLGFINTGKSEKEVGVKHTATTCLGYVYKSAGDSAISLHGLVIASLLKLIKAAQNHTGFRASVFRALAQCIEGLGTSLDESIARDVWKQIRTTLANEKSALVQKYCFICARSLFKHSPYFLNTNDFENLKGLTWKAIDTNVLATRNASCNTLGQVLLRLYSDAKGSEQVPVVKKPKKANRKQGPASDDELEAEKPDSSSSKAASQLALSLADVLKVVSAQYCKPSTSNRARCGLALTYKVILESLPEKVIQDHYADISNHFFNDVLSNATIYTNRIRLLLSRKLVNALLGDLIGVRLLSENGQIQAARWLVNDILKNYPQVIQGRREPSKHALVAALRVLAQLLKQLGPASTVLQDSCREALFQVAVHPSYTVQVHVAHCFKQFVSACPTQLARTLDNALAQLRKQFEQVDGRISRRVSVYALALAAMLRAAQDTPLYGSIDLFAKLFSYATELLKASATSELRLCAAQVQSAWTLLGGLMTLGPNFVKVHLNQLLLLWRNALPAPLTSDNTSRRSQLELSFLTHVRESALTALCAFLEHNSNLVTSDGSRRISTMLQNSIAFADSLPSTRQTEDLSNRLFSSLQLHDHAINLRRRILQCTMKLLSLKHVDRNEVVSLSDTVGMSIRLFSDPARPIQRSVEATLASSASSFEGIWDLSDNWGFGVNSMIDEFEVVFPANGRVLRMGTKSPAPEPLESSINLTASAPLIAALEHDSAAVYCHSTAIDSEGTFLPESTCVTLAIQLFAIALPLQPPRVQESCLEQVATVLAQPMQREPGRKFALQINAITGVLCALAVANGETGFHSGKLAPATSKILAEIARRGVLDHDVVMRSVATQALGRLCYLAGNQFTNNEVKNLVDTIIANREPHVRAGCALALGTIHSQVGAMAASYHLKKIMSVLFTLCSDAHPIVHFWALQGLLEVAESAGLSFSAYASSSLGMLARLYSSDHHNEESSSAANSAAEMEYESPILIGQCVDSIINVLGPDLQDSAKARNLILNLIQYFQNEDIPALELQRYICLGHISLYAPAHVQVASYVHNLQSALSSDQPLLEEIAISGLENLVKRNASEVFLVAERGLAETLWVKLDKKPTHPVLKNMIRTWMQQTCLDETLFWIEQCQSILSRARVKAESKSREQSTAKPKTAVPDLADEEVAGFAAAAAVAEGEKAEPAVEGQEFMRWQTRDFAMSLLSEMLDIIRNAMLADQVITAESVLQSNVAEIVRVAFSASTAVVVELRVRGLHILDQILKMFGRTPDPDFLEASLLEQYQAQISSALTPAFAADSNAELAAEAIAVCATFVATGIVTNPERMGRIFKVLSTGLDNLSQDKPESSIGDLKDLSSNAQSMLKMALLSGWAQLQLASTEQTYLEEIVQPYVPKLAPLWLASLQEFASLRFEPEISDSLGDYATNDLRERYAALDREIRLVFYQKSWLSIVDAIALLVERDSNAVFDALDNKSTTEPKLNGDASTGKDMNFREEPVAFFFILFGLAYEALVTQARDNQAHAQAILSALKRILTPAVSGNAIYQDAVFDETTDTLDRLALTGTTEIQGVLVQIARNLSLDHVIAKTDGRDDKLSEDIDQLFELTRIVILVLAGLIPTLKEQPGQTTRPLSEENINLIQTSFQALVDVADVFPTIIRADLHACIMHCYCTILATGMCQIEVVPRIMPVFRSFLQQVFRAESNTSQQDATNTRLILGTLTRMLQTLTIAQRRENDFSIVCAKNTLLSITILFTTASSVIPPTNKCVIQSMNELLDTLQDVGLAKISAGCVRSLLLTPSKTACDEAISRLLWPHILQFVMNTSAEDPEVVKTILMSSLVSSVSTLAYAGAHVAAMALLIPCLLDRATHPVPNGSKEDLMKESAARLLELAGVDGVAFRGIVAQLESGQRAQLETLLRSAGLGKKESAHRRTATGTIIDEDEDEERGPAIALRMDF